jgi:hypothetical protein
MSTTTTPAPTSTAPHAPAVPRTCRRPGCENKLSLNNLSGFCTEHRPHTKTSGNGKGPHDGFARHTELQAARSGAGAAPAKSNGHDPAHGTGNGDDRLRSLGNSRIQERVKLLLDVVDLPVEEVLEIIPDEDKAKLVEAWLLGTVA